MPPKGTSYNDAAKRVSKGVGPGYTVIHEKPTKPLVGKKYDVHSVYRDGKLVKSSNKPARATGEHIHVQPDFNSRLNNAAQKSTSSTHNDPRSSNNRVKPPLNDKKPKN